MFSWKHLVSIDKLRPSESLENLPPHYLRYLPNSATVIEQWKLQKTKTFDAGQY